MVLFGVVKYSGVCHMSPPIAAHVPHPESLVSSLFFVESFIRYDNTQFLGIFQKCFIL